VSESILVGILSAASALLGVLISRLFDERKTKSEERRWYAGFFLGRKFEALQQLFAALVDCHSAMNYYGNMPPRTIQEYREAVSPKEQAYIRAKVMASLYLEDDAEKIMSRALGAFRQASLSIWLRIPKEELPVDPDTYDKSTKQLDWAELNKTYEAAVDCLRTLLHPSALKEIEPSR
jgi:hypothetical protein